MNLIKLDSESSETLEIISILRWLIIQEDFTAFNFRESLKCLYSLTIADHPVVKGGVRAAMTGSGTPRVTQDPHKLTYDAMACSSIHQFLCHGFVSENHHHCADMHNFLF